MTSSGMGSDLMTDEIGRVARRPNARFPTFDGQLAAHQQPVVDIEARPAKLA